MTIRYWWGICSGWAFFMFKVLITSQGASHNEHKKVQTYIGYRFRDLQFVMGTPWPIYQLMLLNTSFLK